MGLSCSAVFKIDSTKLGHSVIQALTLLGENLSVSIIGIVGVPAKYGGFETLVENLLPLGEGCVIYCQAGMYADKRSHYKKARLVYIPIPANGILSIVYDLVCMLHALITTRNNFLILGVSGAIGIPLVKLFGRGRKIVTNVDGIEHRREKWSALAKYYLKFSEWLAVKFSDQVISDNKGIAEYLVQTYHRESTVIAYGGDHVLRESTGSIDGKFALGICRIEPENNVRMVLEAFREASSVDLKLVGNWEASAFGREMKRSFSECKNIECIDPIYDLDELHILRSSCSFYVHGHSAGGTNPSLVEVLFYAKPVFCFECIYNRYTTWDEAYYFNNKDSLVGLIKKHETSTSDNRMRLLAKKHYRWEIIREQYSSLLEND